MASNGLLKKAKKGTCRICLRSRCTIDKVKAVGEVRHGFAVGHIWECTDVADCDKAAQRRLQSPKLRGDVRAKIEAGITQGRFTEYTILA